VPLAVRVYANFFAHKEQFLRNEMVGHLGVVVSGRLTLTLPRFPTWMCIEGLAFCS